MYAQNYITYVTRTYFLVAMLGLGIAMFLDLYLVLRDPFSPRDRRLKFFYLIPISLMVYVLSSNEQNNDENMKVRLNLLYISFGVNLYLMILII